MTHATMDIQSIDLYIQKLKDGTYVPHLSDADHADFLEVLKQHDEEKFFTYIDLLSVEQRAEILMELPIPFQIDYIQESNEATLSQILEALDSDDATNLFQAIVKEDKEKSQKIFELLSEKTQNVIISLINDPGTVLMP